MTIKAEDRERWLEALKRGREALEAENGPKKPLGWAIRKDEYQGEKEK